MEVLLGSICGWYGENKVPFLKKYGYKKSDKVIVENQVADNIIADSDNLNVQTIQNLSAENSALLRELETLKAQLDLLTKQNVSLTKENEELFNDNVASLNRNVELEKENDSLKKENDFLKIENNYLKEENEKLKKKNDSVKNENSNNVKKKGWWLWLSILEKRQLRQFLFRL